MISDLCDIDGNAVLRLIVIKSLSKYNIDNKMNRRESTSLHTLYNSHNRRRVVFGNQKSQDAAASWFSVWKFCYCKNVFDMIASPDIWERQLAAGGA